MDTQQSPQAPQSASVTVARILRPHGRRGEVACEILTDFPQRFKTLKFAELRGVRGEPRRVGIRSCWLSQSKRSGWGNGSGRKRTASTRLKIAVAAPMPMASVKTAVRVNPGFF